MFLLKLEYLDKPGEERLEKIFVILWDGVRESRETEAGVLLQGGDERGRFVTRGAEGGVNIRCQSVCFPVSYALCVSRECQLELSRDKAKSGARNVRWERYMRTTLHERSNREGISNDFPRVKCQDFSVLSLKRYFFGDLDTGYITHHTFSCNKS